ncbi:MAG: MotA/TolQ/ExbB proton channel family protein [Treponema sp.]|nr:MotA/TolQ/ExbB proton channel family protein [Treponema sp.]
MLGSIKAGGIIMIPIILCGIIATFIIIERCFYFYVTKKKDAKLMYDLQGSLDADNFQAASVSCAEAGTPTAQVIKKALDCRRWDERDLKDAVEAEMSAVVPRFEHLLTALGTISNISTLLGLLGTVTGNIKAFGVLGAGGTMGDPAVLAGAIAEALVTTVAGLVVSIPAVIFYNYFVSRVNRRIIEMESNVTSVVIKLTGRIR